MALFAAWLRFSDTDRNSSHPQTSTLQLSSALLFPPSSNTLLLQLLIGCLLLRGKQNVEKLTADTRKSWTLAVCFCVCETWFGHWDVWTNGTRRWRREWRPAVGNGLELLQLFFLDLTGFGCSKNWVILGGGVTMKRVQHVVGNVQTLYDQTARTMLTCWNADLWFGCWKSRHGGGGVGGVGGGLTPRDWTLCVYCEFVSKVCFYDLTKTAIILSFLSVTKSSRNNALDFMNMKFSFYEASSSSSDHLWE